MGSIEKGLVKTLFSLPEYINLPSLELGSGKRGRGRERRRGRGRERGAEGGAGLSGMLIYVATKLIVSIYIWMLHRYALIDVCKISKKLQVTIL